MFDVPADIAAAIPAPVWVLVAAGVGGLVVATALAIRGGSAAAGADRRAANRLGVAAGTALAAWLVLSGYLAWRGWYLQAPDGGIPWVGVAVVGVLAAVLLAARLPAVRSALSDPATPVRLAVPQVFRVVGVAFLIVMLLGELPAVFALPAGLGDIAVGVAAVVLVRRARRGPVRRAGLVWFHVLGIADLVVAVAVGFLAAPGPAQLIVGSPSTEPLAMLPLALIPTVAVPLAVALHVVSLRRLTPAAHRAGPERMATAG